ncbi:MAG: hypothetical protein AB7S26_29430 [Sandaracinaceae bacterium]
MSSRAFAGELNSSVDSAHDAFGAAVLGVLSHRAATAGHLAEALRRDPSLAAVHAIRGFGLRSLGRRALLPDVRSHLSAGRACLPDDPARGARERALLDALEAFLDDRGPEASDLLERRLTVEPRDLLTAKLLHGARFMLGDAEGMLRGTELALEGFDDADPQRGWLLGCRAFARCELGEAELAERDGHAAVERNRGDVWAIHAVAHARWARHDHRGALEWLVAHRAPLDGGNNFSGHVAWHEALLWTELGRPDEALRAFDARVAIYPTDDYREVSNACSLLYRLERRGVDVGARWDRWVAIARERSGDHQSPFADAHFVLALTERGLPGEADRFIESLARSVREHDEGHDARVAREVGLPLARAIADGSPARVRALLPALSRMGGSRAQRALFGWIASRGDTVRAGRAPAGAEACAWPTS